MKYYFRRASLPTTEDLCDSNRLLNHANQRDQTLLKAKQKPGKVTVSNRTFFERDLQSNSEKFYNNLKVPPSECYYNTAADGAAALSALRSSTTMPIIINNKKFKFSKPSNAWQNASSQ